MQADDGYEAEEFWKRYGELADKDLPIILRTKVKQSTLSTWRTKKTFPRADMAVRIAQSLGTSVEYLVTGGGAEHPACSPWALAVALQVDKLSEPGQKIVFDVARGLELQYPLENSVSIDGAS
jgi:transcriptional regulator with XRE-family HTH domain